MNRNVLRNLAMALLVGVTLAGCVKEYTITVVSNNDAWGTVTGTGTYAFGEEVTITATPVTGYYFQRWDDGVNTNPRIVTVEGTKVYTAVFASNNGDSDPPGTTVSGTINGHDYVDLGLPSGLKWATCNVGATTPEGYGDYFAWAEITTKPNFLQSNSISWRVDWPNDISGNPEYDAATANWESTWRMPTETEMHELVNNCRFERIKLNGVMGLFMTGPNGNTIFLPEAGFYRESGLATGYGRYWTSTPDDHNDHSIHLYTKHSVNIQWQNRYYGLTIRPVSN